MNARERGVVSVLNEMIIAHVLSVGFFLALSCCGGRCIESFIFDCFLFQVNQQMRLFACH